MEKSDKRLWISLFGISLLSFIMYMDYTIVSTALPAIQKGLKASVTELQWVVNACGLFIATMSASMGRFCDLIGSRFMFYLGILIFFIGSLGAGLSPNIELLIFFRVIIGISGAIILTAGFSLVSALFANHPDHAKAIGIFGGVTGSGLALGPALGGMLVHFFSWRAVFFVNIPVIIIGMLICWKTTDESKNIEKNTKIDWGGLVLLVTSLTCLIFAILNSQQFDKYTLILYTLFLVGVGLFIYQEKNCASPILDLKIFKSPAMLLIIFSSFLCGGFNSVNLFVTPLYLSNIHQLASYLIGFIMVSVALSEMIFASLSGRALHTINARLMMVYLCFFYIASAIIFLLLENYLVYWFVFAGLILAGAPWGIINVAPPTSIANDLPKKWMGVAIGAFITFYNIGACVCLSIGTAILKYKEKSVFEQILQQHHIQLDATEERLVNSIIYDPNNAGAALAKFPKDVVNDIIPIFKKSFMEGTYCTYWFLMGFAILILIINKILYNRTLSNGANFKEKEGL